MDAVESDFLVTDRQYHGKEEKSIRYNDQRYVKFDSRSSTNHLIFADVHLTDVSSSQDGNRSRISESATSQDFAEHSFMGRCSENIKVGSNCSLSTGEKRKNPLDFRRIIRTQILSSGGRKIPKIPGKSFFRGKEHRAKKKCFLGGDRRMTSSTEDREILVYNNGDTKISMIDYGSGENSNCTLLGRLNNHLSSDDKNTSSISQTDHLLSSEFTDICRGDRNQRNTFQNFSDGSHLRPTDFDLITESTQDDITRIGTGENDGHWSNYLESFDHSIEGRPKPLLCGPRYRLIKEGQAQIHLLKSNRNLVGKVKTSKLLRRWETHTLVLDEEELRSKTAIGYMEKAIRYVDIEDIHIVPSYLSGDKFSVHMLVPDGSILLQTSRAYVRHQWFYSIQWRRNLFRCCRIIESNCSRQEVILKELKFAVEQEQFLPLRDAHINEKAMDLARVVLQQIEDGKWPKSMMESVFTCIAPLLESVHAISQVSQWLIKHCQAYPRSCIISSVITDAAYVIVKKTMDFGNYVVNRVFVQEFLFALYGQNGGVDRVKEFIRNVHGTGPDSPCPHVRALSNLVCVCLSAVHALCDGNRNNSTNYNDLINPGDSHIAAKRVGCLALVFETMSEFEDWRLSLALILQPVPFPEKVLSQDYFVKPFNRLIRRLGSDTRCDVHLTVLGIRENKDGWFQLFCPGGPSCVDDGDLFASLLKTLMRCRCRRKKFVQSLNAMIGPLKLLALRECESAMEALCRMLEFDVVEGENVKAQIISALQSTPAGKSHYAALCDRQMALRELQQKGGPRKLTLPSKSTDADLAILLSSGSFGNLEWLSLAFTSVTSTCAECLIKLPGLRYLNLWSTQFGDTGVQMISEHLLKLQVLNLCETPVSDKGLRSIAGLTNLRKLNLNSTQLSMSTFQYLRANLPALQEVDVRYTDAWCAEEFLAWSMFGPPTEEIVDLIQKGRLIPLMVNLYSIDKGYTVVFPASSDGRQRETRYFNYEDESELLDDIEKHRLPLFLIDLIDRYCCFTNGSEFFTIYYKGCIGVEIHDYRNINENLRSGEPKYELLYSVLRPTPASLLSDLEMLQRGLIIMEKSKQLERPSSLENAEAIFNRLSKLENERLTLESDFWRLVTSNGALRDEPTTGTSNQSKPCRRKILRYDVRARRRREMRLCLEQHFPIMNWVCNNTIPGQHRSKCTRITHQWTPLTSVASGTSQWKPLIPTILKTPTEIAEKRYRRVQMQQEQQQTEFVDGMELIEEYGIDMPSQKQKTRTRIRIYRRCLDSVYVGHLILERDDVGMSTLIVDGNEEQEQPQPQEATDTTSECRFLLGTEADSRSYIRQYLDMVSEGGRKPLTLTMRVPGKAPQVIPQNTRGIDPILVPSTTPISTNAPQNQMYRPPQYQQIQCVPGRKSHSLSQDTIDPSNLLQAASFLQNQVSDKFFMQ